MPVHSKQNWFLAWRDQSKPKIIDNQKRERECCVVRPNYWKMEKDWSTFPHSRWNKIRVIRRVLMSWLLVTFYSTSIWKLWLKNCEFIRWWKCWMSYSVSVSQTGCKCCTVGTKSVNRWNYMAYVGVGVATSTKRCRCSVSFIRKITTQLICKFHPSLFVCSFLSLWLLLSVSGYWIELVIQWST